MIVFPFLRKVAVFENVICVNSFDIVVYSYVNICYLHLKE